MSVVRKWEKSKIDTITKKHKKEDERVMKRKMAKLVATFTMTAMVMGALAGCGGSGNSGSTGADSGSDAAAEESTDAAADDTGKLLVESFKIGGYF